MVGSNGSVSSSTIHPTVNVDETNHAESETQTSPFRVLGIAMVVDQLGKGPRMVLRYPTTSSTHGADLFYRLPGRQMAKLFRPKPSLCGQPMTLSVGGTVFCCCAVLMDEQPPDDALPTAQTLGDGSVPPENASTTTASSSKDHLVLFSVIVALAPPLRTSSLPFGSWMEPEQPHGQPETGGWKPSATFLCVRRVHVSLARLCRVLEREERRCRYVSTQANLFAQIRQDVLSGENQLTSTVFHGSTNSPPPRQDVSETPEAVAATAGMTSLSPETTVTTTTTPATRHAVHQRSASHASSPPSLTLPSQPPVAATGPTPSRQNRPGGSFALSLDREAVNDTSPSWGVRVPRPDAEQEILETILASPPTRTVWQLMDVVVHHGNLARELLQVYHALARNDHPSPVEQTPTNLLSGRDNVVYINRHLAVVIEAVARNKESQCGQELLDGRPTALIRPYHTLYFPTVSPDQLLASMASVHGVTSSTAVAPRRLPLLLQHVNPQRSLSEIAFHAGLSMSATMEIASNLVAQGVCLTLPIVSRNMRLACRGMGTIRQAALPFAQTFGSSIHLFVLVSFLTDTERTLGETMTLLHNSNETLVTRLRLGLRAALPLGARYEDDATIRLRPPIRHQDSNEAQGVELEDLVYQMVVWLCSHRVLIQLQEYLVTTVDPETRRKQLIVPTESGYQQLPLGDHPHSERKSDSNARLDSLSDDELYKVLWESACLTGTVSTAACSWKLGIDASRLQAFLARTACIRRVTRVPMAGDDWDAQID